MAIIPIGQKFHTLTSSTVTSDLGSARANSGREVYTMQDIINTVSATGGSIDGSGVQYALPVFTDTNTITNLAIGTAGQVLTSNGAGANPSFQTLASTATQFDESFTNITSSSDPNNLIGRFVVSPSAHPNLGTVYPLDTTVLGSEIGNNGSLANGFSGKISNLNVFLGQQIINNITPGVGSFVGPINQRNNIIGSQILDNYTSNEFSFATEANIMGFNMLSGSSLAFSGGLGTGVRYSTIIGSESGNLLTGGVTGFERCVWIGYEIEGQGSTGGFNDQVIIGAKACASNGAAQITVVGALAGNIPPGGNSTLLGYNAQPSASGASDEFTLGNSSISVLRCQQTSITSLSDERDKTDIVDLDSGLDLITSLKPRKFVWDIREEKIVQTKEVVDDKTGEITKVDEEIVVPNANNGTKDVGFIAQELQTVDDEFLRLVYSANPDKLEASYGRLIPVLVKAIQELKEQLDNKQDK